MTFSAELTVSVKFDLKLWLYEVGFLEKLLTFNITKSRWRRIPFDVTEENPAGYTGKMWTKKNEKRFETRLSEDERGFSRSRTQSLHILPPANKGQWFIQFIGNFASHYLALFMFSHKFFSSIFANEDVYKRIVIITSTFICLYQIFAFMCNTN